MTADSAVFDRVAEATEGDEVRLTLATEDATVGGVDFASPVVTRVAAVREETVDARQKDVDIDGIVDRRILHLVPLGDDDAHSAYVLETRSPVVGADAVEPLRAQPRDGCGPSDDVTTLPVVAEVESIEVRS
ncbi:hypothetical protein [Halobellus rubicundus]|uniref:Uncharacterized protein n=1 Tax=Halobellus rubicundus TaxID=2996466 RepID=A0ABD5MGK3_9EURY